MKLLVYRAISTPCCEKLYLVHRVPVCERRATTIQKSVLYHVVNVRVGSVLSEESSMKKRIADWHGEQAANYYRDWTYFNRPEDLDSYARHIAIADRMWR